MPIGQINNNESGASVRAKLNNVISVVSPLYDRKIYRAWVQQSGTNAPTEVAVFENTLGGNLTWSRTGAGDYLASLTGAFPAGKVFSMISPIPGTNTGLGMDWVRNNNDSMALRTYVNGTLTDGVLNAMVEVQVYP